MVTAFKEDMESGHMEGDRVLCDMAELLAVAFDGMKDSVGAADVREAVRIFKDAPKWYA